MPIAPRKHTHRIRKIKAHLITGRNRRRAATFSGIDRDGNPYTTGKDPRRTDRWRKVRLIQLGKNPMCFDPLEHHEKYNEAAPAVDVHHVLGVSTHHHLAFKIGNLASLCENCHMKIELLERKGKSTQELFKWALSDDET